MRRKIGISLLAALFAFNSAGPGCYEALAQVARVPAGVGQSVGGTMGAVGTTSPILGSPQSLLPAPSSPGLGVAPILPDAVSPVAPALDPAVPLLPATIIPESRLLQAPVQSLLPAAQQAVEAAKPGLLAPGVSGASVPLPLKTGSGQAALESLRSAVGQIERLKASNSAQEGSPEAAKLIDRLYGLYAHNDNTETAAPAASTIQPQPQNDLPAVVEVPDARQALSDIAQKAIHDPQFELMTSQLARLYPELGIKTEATFLIPREPELLKLLKMPDDVSGAARVLSDMRQNLPVLIVTVPKEGRITRAALAETLLHEALHGSDRGVFRVPASQALSHALIEGYTQKRTQDMLFKARGTLDIPYEPTARYAAEVRLVESLVQAVGEEPLRVLARTGKDAVLREALGARWDYMRAMADAAKQNEPSGGKAELLETFSRIAHRGDYSLRDFKQTLEAAFPGKPAAVARILLEFEEGLASPRPSRVERWSRHFRPDFPARTASFRTKLGEALKFSLLFTAIYNALHLAATWLLDGIFPPFVDVSPTLPLFALPLILLINNPVTAFGEELIFRGHVNPWIERRFGRLGVSPQKAAFWAAMLGSGLFAAVHIPAQGFDPINLSMKFVMGLAMTKMYQKHGLGAAILTHYIWNSLVYAALIFPILVPLQILATIVLHVAMMFRAKPKT